MAGYTRQSSANMISGNTIYASDLNNEFNAIQAAFDGNAGHFHDGTTGNGPKINLNTSIVGILPVSNGGTGGINNLSATGAPTTSSDSNGGYSVGSLWIDTTNNVVYICVDDTVASAIWIRHQVYSSALASIAGLTTSANQMIYTTASNLYATTSLTAYGRSLLDDVDAAAARTTLGLGTIATQNANSVAITGGSITGITDLAIADGGTGASDAATARTNLGLGTISTQNSSSVAITGGSITGITDLAIADGGTGASTAVNALANLGGASTTTQVNAGNGLTGGGDLSTNRSIALGTPSTITTSTTNSVTGTTHTHAITLTSSDITTSLGYTPANKAGDTFTGKVNTVASNTSNAGLNVPHGTAPTTPVDGDVWTTSANGLVYQVNGVTRTSYDTTNLPTVTQAEAEAGVVTSVRAYTPQRVAQAISALAPSDVKAWVNFNGAGASIVIRGSKNVSSVTDNGIGDYTINFTTPLVDGNYAVGLAAPPTNGRTPFLYNGTFNSGGATMTASGFRVGYAEYTSITFTDAQYFTAIVTR